MTYDITYAKQLYRLTLDDNGQPYELVAVQPYGPDLIVDTDTLPSWLTAKVQQWYEVQQDENQNRHYRHSR